MATGLIALLDDVAAIAKLAAASVDDVAAQAAKAGAKSAGLVIDDTAVTPRYVVGLAPARELPIIARIAVGSARNKMLILLPAALVLSLFAPWLIAPLLMLGGAFLCYEGAEKIYEALFPHDAHAHEAKLEVATEPRALEDKKVASAVRTDFILSAEIMFIALSTMPAAGFWMQAVVLAIVGLGITALVYGAVGLLVKLDDIGVALSTRGRLGLTRGFGRGLVAAMPGMLKTLAIVGTAAMLWVGGGILIHGLATFGFTEPEHLVHDLAHAVEQAVPIAAKASGWLAGAAAAGILGLAAGALIIPIVGRAIAPAYERLAKLRG
jgi:predicted DNA repair protein MutK